ncbi:hypothetical protein LJR099_003942 [Variovorax paradoxus]|uniref:hypothetical protein n=1 Tax=Variovorax paradoxus TaxID=34073 RepID=UPI003999D92A
MSTPQITAQIYDYTDSSGVTHMAVVHDEGAGRLHQAHDDCGALPDRAVQGGLNHHW